MPAGVISEHIGLAPDSFERLSNAPVVIQIFERNFFNGGEHVSRERIKRTNIDAGTIGAQPRADHIDGGARKAKHQNAIGLNALDVDHVHNFFRDDESLARAGTAVDDDHLTRRGFDDRLLR